MAMRGEGAVGSAEICGEEVGVLRSGGSGS